MPTQSFLPIDDRQLLEMLQSAVEVMSDLIVIFSPELRASGPTVLYVNPAFEKLTGYRREEVTGKSTAKLQGAKTDRRVLARLRRSLEKGVPFVGQMYSYRKDGAPILLSWEVTPIRDDAGNLKYWVGVERDVTERNRLLRELLEVGARERRRLSHALHDSLGQQLAGVAFLCKVLEHDLAAKDLPQAEIANEIRRLVADAVEQTRTLATNLIPLHEDPGGLVSSLRELADGTTKLYRITCRCYADDEIVVHDLSVADDLYYIASEAVSNAIKHAEATEIIIRLEHEANRLELSVTDNGKGIPSITGRDGMGLRIMAYRADSIGGGLEIGRLPARGTRVSVSVTLDESSS